MPESEYVKYIDKPWKIFLWIIVIDRLLKSPLRFFKSYFTMGTLDLFSIITIFTFLISVIIVGYLYSKVTKKIMEKKLRFRASLYVSIFTLLIGLLLVFITGWFFFGATEVIITSVINFFIVYYLIIIGCKLYKK